MQDFEIPTRRDRLKRLSGRGGLLLGLALLMLALAGQARRVRAADEALPPSPEFASQTIGSLQVQLEAARGDLAVAQLAVERTEEILRYSAKYQIPADLATAIYDVALSEGIDPGIGFRLVQVESNFKRGARSHADAFGYTQVQLPTARYYLPDVTADQLYDRDTNLRVGFRFLRDLLGHFDGDLRLALLAYNRGPARVRQILSQGGDPGNGYAKAVMGG